MSDHIEKPLITFFVMTYNQEKYIKEAVLGALAQTYSPLEIIISDDNSTDKTFEIIKETTEAYNGPHKIILNRNEKNMGLIGHFNKVIAMTHGELLIGGAGDDISLPNRVQTIFDRWYPNKDSVSALVSSSITIDDDGKEVLPCLFEIKEDKEISDFYTEESMHGACVAYSSKVFKTFGPITKNCYEDVVCFRRSLLLGKVLFFKDKLVKYRLGGISTNNSNRLSNYTVFREFKFKELKRGNEVIKQLIDDVDKLEKNEKTEKIKAGLLFVNDVQEKRIRFYESDSLWEKLCLLVKLIPGFAVKRNDIIQQFRFKSHHWTRMIKDLLPDSINNIFYKDNSLLSKIKK